MSSTRAEGAPAALRRALSPASLIVAAALAAGAALAWAWLLAMPASEDGMAGMAMAVDPWSAAYLLPAFAMWTVMMAAMMLPSAAPMILLHVRIDRAGSERVRLLHSLIFAGAYLLVWTGFSALAAMAQALLIAAGALSAAALSLGGRALVAALLAAAALYELTAAKRLCLENCRSPLHFVMRHWRPGAAGALRLGVAHGLYCVGCCWGLMLLLFAGGVMNLAWVAALALVVLAEKVAPPSWNAHLWIAAALFAAAAALLLA